jgi:predicted PurR-regulated permease PerM
MIGLGLLGFKQLLGLAVMIFFFSLIPVAGTIASLIPLSIIAFNNGGIKKILFVCILIAALHALESYVLNPKFMAAKTELPVFIIFIVLIVSEHFMGVWGLLIGIPLFMFLLDLINIKAAD